MSDDPLFGGNAAERLRRSFDQAFAEPPPSADTDVEALLGIVVRDEPYAIRLGEVTALLADQKIVPLPSPSQEQLGLTGVRGVVVPVYDLGSLLGYPKGNEPGRYIVVAGKIHSVGFAFQRFDGYRRVPRSRISTAAKGAARAHCTEVAELEGEQRVVIVMQSIVTSIAERVAPGRSNRES